MCPPARDLSSAIISLPRPPPVKSTVRSRLVRHFGRFSSCPDLLTGQSGRGRNFNSRFAAFLSPDICKPRFVCFPAKNAGLPGRNPWNCSINTWNGRLVVNRSPVLLTMAQGVSRYHPSRDGGWCVNRPQWGGDSLCPSVKEREAAGTDIASHERGHSEVVKIIELVIMLFSKL
ncbi:hypothetical protein J6590_004621 [Homalodisca vitripennis]|nr:hypothetical protein J6590_004621 [Homalodisca vitripennis]